MSAALASAQPGTVAATLARMRGLPHIDLDGLLAGTTPLILAPHQDDESLGCGGLIAAACAANRPPFVLFLTDGTGSHPNSASYPASRLAALREAEALRALAELGLRPSRIGFLRLRDTAAPCDGPAFDAAVTAIVDIAERHGCGSILAPWRHDPHCDHLAGHLMAAAAAERLGVTHLAYPVWGWTLPGDMALAEPIRGHRLDIRAFLPAKRRAIAAHRSQLGQVIDDDPEGFTLPAHLLEIFDGPDETFLQVS